MDNKLKIAGYVSLVAVVVTTIVGIANNHKLANDAHAGTATGSSTVPPFGSAKAGVVIDSTALVLTLVSLGLIVAASRQS